MERLVVRDCCSDCGASLPSRDMFECAEYLCEDCKAKRREERINELGYHNVIDEEESDITFMLKSSI